MAKLKRFLWRGIDESGQLISGEVFGENKHQAAQKIAQPHRVMIRIQETIQWRRSSIKPKDILEFFKHLSLLLQTGIPLHQGLKLLSENNQLWMMQELLQAIQKDLDQGFHFSQALGQHPRYFKPMMIDLIEAGEQTGQLPLLMKQLVIFLERLKNTRSKIKKALFYPTLVLGVSILVTIALLMFVVPQFQNMFSNFGGQLPALTRAVVIASNQLKHHGFYIALFAAGIFTGMRMMVKKFPKLSIFLDFLKTKLPGIGTLIRQSKLIQWTSVLSTSFRAGIASFPALLLANQVIAGSHDKQALRLVAEKVKAGLGFHEALLYCPLFPQHFIELIRLGETSGDLTEMLERVAETQTIELNDALERVTKWLEPLLMILVAGMAGTLMIALYLPVFKMGSVM